MSVCPSVFLKRSLTATAVAHYHMSMTELADKSNEYAAQNLKCLVLYRIIRIYLFKVQMG